jgi:hypothetical protein
MLTPTLFIHPPVTGDVESGAVSYLLCDEDGVVHHLLHINEKGHELLINMLSFLYQNRDLTPEMKDNMLLATVEALTVDLNRSAWVVDERARVLMANWTFSAAFRMPIGLPKPLSDELLVSLTAALKRVWAEAMLNGIEPEPGSSSNLH